MTGHQPHPGTGKTMMGQVVEKVSIENVLKGIGVTCVETVDPLNHALAVETVRKTADLPGVKAIIFRSPCVALFRTEKRMTVNPDACIGCKKCIREIGCPALSFRDGKAVTDPAQCNGCSLCAQLCPAGAISGGDPHE
jgi:indolepyruvate ferredoxin oxidoreductase alpha subunit